MARWTRARSWGSGWRGRAIEHAEDSEPLRHLRKRNGRALTLYYYGYDHQRVKEEGFTERDLTHWELTRRNQALS